MKLLQVTNSRLPSADANAVQVTAMATALSEHVEVVLTARRQDGASIDEVREVYALADTVDVVLDARRGLGWRGSVDYAVRLRSLARDRMTDHAYGRDPIGLLAVTSRTRPTIYEVHQPADDRTRAVVERVLFHRPRVGLVFITEALRSWYQEHVRIPAAVSTIVLPDGAATPLDVPRIPAPRQRRIGYFGSLHEGKGMEMITQLGEVLPYAEIHVYGGQADQVERWRSAQRGGNVTIHGWIPHSSVRRRMQEMDVLLAPYANHSYGVSGAVDISRFMSPLKVFEYMAARRPMVVSDLPVLRELLDDERTALLCTPGAAGDWAEAVERLLDKPQLGDALADAAYVDLCDRFSWSTRAADLIEFARGL